MEKNSLYNRRRILGGVIKEVCDFESKIVFQINKELNGRNIACYVVRMNGGDAINVFCCCE